MVGALMAIAFLVVTRGQAIELRGSSVGTGGYRDSRYRLRRAGESVAPQVPAMASAGVDVGVNAGGTAVLEAIRAPHRQANATPTVPQAGIPLSPQRLSLADTLDNVSYRIIGLGFPLLTIGIIAGAVWANEAWGSYWSWDPKETWALITWLVFAAYLHSRITRGWQGRRPAILAASGFLVVWVCYLGVNLLGKGLHSYGWFF